MQLLLYVQRVILCSVNDIQNDGTASVNPAFTEAGPRRMQAASSVAILIVAQRHQPVSCDDASYGSGESGAVATSTSSPSSHAIRNERSSRRMWNAASASPWSTSSRVLALMERSGLIVRESVPRDARLKKIVLTDKSRDIAEALRANAVAMEGILLQGLSDDEIRGIHARAST